MKATFKKILGVALFACGAIALLLMNGLLLKLAETETCTEDIAVDGSVITFTDTGVSPVCSAVSSGSKVTWVNASGALVQIGSDAHPLHSDNSEISDGRFVLELGPGQSASVTLTTVGTFGFHDHVKPTRAGKIIIK